MYIALLVSFLLITRVVSYPSLREIATDDEENSNDLQLELRSILNHLNDKELERSVASDEDDSNQYENPVNKRQGGYNIIKPDLKCEIECVGRLRNPSSGQGASIKDAANTCKNICLNANKKRGQQNEQSYQKSLRVFSVDDNDESDEQ